MSDFERWERELKEPDATYLLMEYIRGERASLTEEERRACLGVIYNGLLRLDIERFETGEIPLEYPLRDDGESGQAAS